MREIPVRVDFRGTFVNPEDPQFRAVREELTRRSCCRREGIRLLSADNLEMMYPTRVYLSWSLLAVAVIPVSLGEMYTSLLNVKQAIGVERKLIDYLRTYIDHESERLEDIKRFYAKVSDLHTELYQGPATAMANPLVAFSLIKRLHSEWLNVVHSNEALENTQALRSSYKEEEGDLPKLEDLQGAAKGLMRLQDVYALQVAGLVRGRFQRVTNGEPIDVYLPAVSVALSGDDCFLVGKVHNPLFSFIFSSRCFNSY
ncbi:prolyl 4-hydroxylase subunit alpha-3-like [Anarrhichthys ocellatus]|uniref:prolyl 4-hydroxylase subunit alpha-3-like n=1 Tax=Anarrhichthys ocellatus TaxID=433405 RepID=UPI0012ED5E3D|nr:prolyl 4-hydroxylase subunit alpha-3-like [Anarrhichthys ocellatus]